MTPYDAKTDSKPETHTCLRLRCIERVKYTRTDLVAHAAAGIAYTQLNPVGGFPCGQSQSTTVGHCIYCIEDHVDQYFTKFARVAINPGLGINVQDQIDVDIAGLGLILPSWSGDFPDFPQQ